MTGSAETSPAPWTLERRDDCSGFRLSDADGSIIDLLSESRYVDERAATLPRGIDRDEATGCARALLSKARSLRIVDATVQETASGAARVWL